MKPYEFNSKYYFKDFDRADLNFTVPFCINLHKYRDTNLRKTQYLGFLRLFYKILFRNYVYNKYHIICHNFERKYFITGDMVGVKVNRPK